jgi:hypothetical protein|tara:strand:+ start:118 stop:828 length:711 start_codon:yes stop_codon:yes gene_type:complete
MYTYTGLSWANSSYPIEDENATNLAKLWNIPHIDQSFVPLDSSCFLQNLENLKETTGPVVWLYHEPISLIKHVCNLTLSDLLVRDDWRDIWKECNQFCLKSIAKLGRPVLLIGASCDIVDCDYENIVVGHKSWQRFLASQAGMITRKGKINVKMDDGGSFSFRHCWAAEVVHMSMHKNPNINPSKSLTEEIWNIFFFRKQLERNNLFYEVHPNVKGNELFAEHMKPVIENFLKENL